MSIARVDVVLPVYNAEKTVEGAVASIQAQTVRDIRIIIVDDGSTDSTGQILDRIASADKRITLLRRANGGIVDALNEGLAACTADIVARHDADDLASSDRFEKQLAYLRAHPDCIAVSGAVLQIDDVGQPIGPVYALPSPELADLDWYPQREPYLIHPFLMARRAAIEQVGCYRHVFHAEDTDLYWRLQEVGRLANMPDLLGMYRIHAQSVTGASVVNGRVSALCSQLAGISARRRRAGRNDIAFPKEALREYKDACSLEAIIEAGSRDLDVDEADRLAAGVSAKLLELAGYRPFELEKDDCTFIRLTILRALPRMKPKNRGFCIRMLAGAAARLAATGRVSAALQLAPPRLYPAVGARLALRTAVPLPLFRAMRRAIGRAAFVK